MFIVIFQINMMVPGHLLQKMMRSPKSTSQPSDRRTRITNSRCSRPRVQRRKGVGKTRQGDEKTPLGTYSLGHPRKSNEGFGTFINVGYPTRAQRSKGYTGSAIGVHGPKQKLRFFGPLSSFVDWTAGCIALATNKEMTEIAKWVKKNRVGKIHVRRGS